VIDGTTSFNGQPGIHWPSKVLRGDIFAGFIIDLAHKALSLICAQADFSALIDVLCDLVGIPKPRLAAPEAPPPTSRA
jgi:4-hydroxybutyrate dehydrogenase / sulfolactaldehyde 3-reductase